MALETLTEDEWVKIAAESEEIGFCLTGTAGGLEAETPSVGCGNRRRRD